MTRMLKLEVAQINLKKHQLLNTVRFKCLISLRVGREKREKGEDRRREEGEKETGGDRRQTERDRYRQTDRSSMRCVHSGDTM